MISTLKYAFKLDLMSHPDSGQATVGMKKLTFNLRRPSLEWHRKCWFGKLLGGFRAEVDFAYRQ